VNTTLLLAVATSLSCTAAALSFAWLSLAWWSHRKTSLLIALACFLVVFAGVLQLAAFSYPERAWYLLATLPLPVVSWHWLRVTRLGKAVNSIFIGGIALVVLVPLGVVASTYLRQSQSQSAAEASITLYQQALSIQVTKLAQIAAAEADRAELRTSCTDTTQAAGVRGQLLRNRLAEVQSGSYTLTDSSGLVLARAHTTTSGDQYDLRAPWHRQVQSGKAITGVGYGEAGQLAIIAAEPIKQKGLTVCTLVLTQPIPPFTNSTLAIRNNTGKLAGDAPSGVTLVVEKEISQVLPETSLWLMSTLHD
jgi:hypothetical protein